MKQINDSQIIYTDETITAENKNTFKEKITEFVNKHAEIWKFIKFTFTGASTSVLELAVFWLLQYVIFKSLNEVPVTDNQVLSFLGIEYKGYMYSYFISAVIGYAAAYVMNRMMQNVITQQDGTGRYAKLNNTDLVGKTGTSSDWFDLSFVGCTPDYVSGIWIGYENPATIPTNEYQNIGAIWKNVFGDIAENEKHKSFEKTFKMPDTVEKLTYCTKTGKLASNSCYSTATGYYKKSNEPEYCSGNH